MAAPKDVRKAKRRKILDSRFCGFCKDLKFSTEFATKTTSNCRHARYLICNTCLHDYIVTTKSAAIYCPLKTVTKTNYPSLNCRSLFELHDIRKLLNLSEYTKYLDIYIAAKKIPLEQVPEEQAPEPGAAAGSETKSPAPTFDCVVCLETLSISYLPGEKVTSACAHDLAVCTPCLLSSISFTITDADWAHPTCPQCPIRLSYSEIQKIVDPDILEKYCSRVFLEAISGMSDFRWCTNKNCDSGQLHSGGEDSPIITCCKCGDKTCFVHSIKWHEGDTCAEFQAKKDADKTEKASQLHLEETTKTCPNAICGMRVEKISGCNHMTCSKCRYQYCWLCLAGFDDILSHGNHFHKKECEYYSDYEDGEAETE